MKFYLKVLDNGQPNRKPTSIIEVLQIKPFLACDIGKQPYILPYHHLFNCVGGIVWFEVPTDFVQVVRVKVGFSSIGLVVTYQLKLLGSFGGNYHSIVAIHSIFLFLIYLYNCPKKKKVKRSTFVICVNRNLWPVCKEKKALQH